MYSLKLNIIIPLTVQFVLTFLFDLSHSVINFFFIDIFTSLAIAERCRPTSPIGFMADMPRIASFYRAFVDLKFMFIFMLLTGASSALHGNQMIQGGLRRFVLHLDANHAKQLFSFLLFHQIEALARGYHATLVAVEETFPRL